MTSLVLFLSLTLPVIASLVAGDEWDCADYYWRDYYGVIPADAVPAGLDHNGDTLYIGLVYIKGVELLPGTIFPKQELIRTSAHTTVYNTDQYVKILCSTHTEAFDWIAIESKDLAGYSSRNLIPGGSEVGESLYIGRVYRNNDVIIGKIFKHERANRGIWFPVETTVASSLSYEILLFDCDKVEHKLDLRSNTSDNESRIWTY